MSERLRRGLRAVAAAGWLAAAGSVALAQGDGMFADFTTSHGDFTVRLDYERAPRAVASFAGLATGEIGWLDAQGRVRHKPYYDGSLIHRIAPDNLGNPLAVQGGGIEIFGGFSYEAASGGEPQFDTGGYLIISTNPPGVRTNLFTGISFVTENAAGIPTNYVYAGEVFSGIAPVSTLTGYSVMLSSSNASQFVTNSIFNQNEFVNRTDRIVETTNWVDIFTVTTNPGPGNEVLLHRLVASMASSGTVYTIAGVKTNFGHSGYTMPDNATNGLTHSNGVISMANSGPNTDGSQYFITVTSVPSWDGSYSVFGNVVSGMDVVEAISTNAVREADERPLSDIVVSNVVIRRVGVAASEFDIAAHGVPVVESAEAAIAGMSGGVVRLSVPVPPHAEMWLGTASNLTGRWESEYGGYHDFGVPLIETNMPQSGDRGFYHVAAVSYGDAWTAPSGPWGKTFTAVMATDPVTTMKVWFASTENGAHVYQRAWGTNALSGNLFSGPWAPHWQERAYSAKLYLTDNLSEQEYELRFDPGASEQRFTLREVYHTIPGSVLRRVGTFTME